MCHWHAEPNADGADSVRGPFSKISTASTSSTVRGSAAASPRSTKKGTTMNATSNPQAAADQARKNYREMTSPDGSVPEAVRSMNEKTVAQTREVYDRSKDAFDAQVSTLERTFDAAGQGVVAFNRKFVDIAQRNVNTAFDLAKSMAGAKNLAEILQLQGDYWQKLCGNLTSQAEEVRALSSKVTAAAGEQVKRGVDELRKAK